MTQATLTIGQRIEIPVHYDMWMRGARFGTVTQFRKGSPGRSAFYYVKMDNPNVKRSLKLWLPDVEFARVIGA